MNEIKSEEGFSFIELFVTLIIIAVLSGIGFIIFLNMAERQIEREAEVGLRAIWSAQQDHFAFFEQYAASLADLALDDPGAVKGSHFNYEITISGGDLQLKACRKNTNRGYKIDRGGNITDISDPPNPVTCP
ncbi:MAG: hypothetical protein AB1629_00345 [Candidatus Omnitrophota bacterium]